jgi:CheY-like chemotaxis protein/HPt (histidine-containing phosphotransfer) domain-containing protein
MVPTLADSASAALDELETATKRGQSFDLVLLDAMMAGVDGFQLAEMLRDRTDLECGTVMMLSSADRPKSAARCRELGIVGYFVKPISASTLLDAILTTLFRDGDPVRPQSDAEVGTDASQNRQTKAQRVQASPQDAQPSQRLRVLVADDHEANRQLATTVLTKRGHRCAEVTDGHEALTLLEREPIDIVLMDVQMPSMDGFQATAAIRDKERTTGRHLPIIALTAHAMKGDREKCLAAGMDAYLAKPLRPRELVALVESIVQASTDAEVEAVTSGAVDSSLSQEIERPPFDFDAALESMDNDIDLLVQQMQYLLHDGPQLIDRIREAIDTENARQLDLSAHRLKGLVARYAAKDATDLAYELEQRGKKGSLNGAAEICDRLAPLVQQLAEAIERYVADHSNGD